jgi:hypothetical protein
VLQVGKRNVGVKAIEPVGMYAVKLVFSDGHDTGIYSWEYLHELGRSTNPTGRPTSRASSRRQEPRRMTRQDHALRLPQVPEDEKAKRVGDVFRSVAPSYDVMNDLMSLGLHRVWKRFALEMSGVREGSRVLDVASGSGDLAAAFASASGRRAKCG